jgi:hypothetical protein
MPNLVLLFFIILSIQETSVPSHHFSLMRVVAEKSGRYI